MPIWKPVKEFEGQDVFIIGGGDSLTGFDFGLLKDKNTIGCNTAFTLGHEVCKICIFADPPWYERFKHDLWKFKGRVVSNHKHFAVSKDAKLSYIPREQRGVYHDKLGFNGSTGAMAINLAILLGASRIFLLGIDLELGQGGKRNWHNHQIKSHNEGIYEKFRAGFMRVKTEASEKFPHVQIINLNPQSKLEVFPKDDWRKYL